MTKNYCADFIMLDLHLQSINQDSRVNRFPSFPIRKIMLLSPLQRDILESSF